MNPTLRPRHLALLVVALLLAACAAAAPTPAVLPTMPPLPPETPTPVPSPTHPGPTYPPGCPTAQPSPLAADANRTVTITTSLGPIVIRVEGKLSPIAAGNFVALASCGYYDNVVFHRVVPNFVIQGGDGEFGRSPDVIPELVGSGGPPYRIKDEKVTATYHRGTVAMARTADPDSAGSQFFIVLSDTAAAALADPKANNYQIIGTVTSGMETADAIASAAGGVEIPSNPIAMTKVAVAP